jgi:capsid protein
MKPTLFQRAVLRIAKAAGLQTRLYASAKYGRMQQGFGGSTSSADSELSSALSMLRSRSRQLMRDSAYARRAREVIVNNVIGSGVGMQSQIMTSDGDLAKTVNDAVETAWCDWTRADSCHTGGTLHFADIERLAFKEVVTAGEVFIRKHFRKFGDSKVPLGLEVIEAERMIDDAAVPVAGITARVRMGVELDEFNRPTAYYFRRKHPGDRRWAGQPAGGPTAPAAWGGVSSSAARSRRMAKASSSDGAARPRCRPRRSASASSSTSRKSSWASSRFRARWPSVPPA